MLVLESPRVSALHGDPRALPAKAFPLTDPLWAMSTRHATDAHTVCYVVAGSQKMPRLANAGAAYLLSIGAGPKMAYAFVDVDNPGHTAWQADAWPREHARLRQIPFLATAGIYQTRHGYRLVWRVPVPFDARYGTGYLEDLVDELAKHGVHGDRAAARWNQLFRLPRVRRDGNDEDLTVDLERFGFLSWQPSTWREYDFGTPATELRGVDTAYPKVEWPTDKEYKKLKHNKSWYERISSKQPLAQKGDRNRQIMRAAAALCNLLDTSEPEEVFRFLAPCVVADLTEGAPTLEEAWGICCRICESDRPEREIDHKIHAAVLDAAEAKRAKTPRHDEDDDIAQPLGIEPAPPDPTWDDVHTNADLAALYEEEKKRIVLFSGATYYVRNTAEPALGQYLGPFTGTAMPGQLIRWCASNLATEVMSENEAGKKIIKTDREILWKHGSPAGNVTFVYGQRGNTYEPHSNELRIGCCWDTVQAKPVYHEDVAIWLNLLASGNDAKLLDWLATFHQIDRPTCALYLEGPKGAGKSFLATALARTYGSAAVSWSTTMNSPFGGGHLRNPFLVAEETLRTSRLDVSITARFRDMTTSSHREIQLKGKESVSLEGCYRVMITANGSVFEADENLSYWDYQAVIDRLGHVLASDEAERYLLGLGRETTASWLKTNRILEHVAWLRENRTVVPGSRFLVTGWETDLHRRILCEMGINAFLLEMIAWFITKYCLHTAPGRHSPKAVLAGNGKCRVNIPQLEAIWTNCFSNRVKVPTKVALRNALEALSVDPYAKADDLYWDVRPELVAWVAHDRGVAREEDVLGAISRKLDT